MQIIEGLDYQSKDTWFKSEIVILDDPEIMEIGIGRIFLYVEQRKDFINGFQKEVKLFESLNDAYLFMYDRYSAFVENWKNV